jgi:threonine/homoserine/homoserine lactone efflux protein
VRADLLLAFAAAWGALVVLPGPDTALVVARAVGNGRRAGVVAAAGSLTALAAHVTLAALGLSALVAQSATAFTAIKLAGAAYLVWLGLRMLRTRSADGNLRPPIAVPGFRGAVLTGLLNPKSAVFFLTFLPQVIDRDLAAAPQFAVLGLVTIVLAGLWHAVLIALTGGVRRVVAGPWFQRVTGGAFVVLGAKLAAG